MPASARATPLSPGRPANPGHAPQLDPEHRQGNVALWAGLAKARWRLQQWDEAIEAWDAVLTLSPGHIEALESRIRCAP